MTHKLRCEACSLGLGRAAECSKRTTDLKPLQTSMLWLGEVENYTRERSLFAVFWLQPLV
jgi:hypothetical protein